LITLSENNHGLLQAVFRVINDNQWEGIMLRWALTFFIIAIIAALFGFGGIAATASGIAQILFYIFLVLFIVALLIGLLGGRTPTPPV
jgi:uncharacterized membrane protein YtjA (UPF0391 family)